MNAQYMLDTDVCIYLKKRRSASIEARFYSLRLGDVVISMITYGELYNGALKSRESAAALRNLQLLTEHLPVQPMDTQVAEHYGLIRSDLEKRGLIIGGNDLWIAAHAITLNLTLVTNNVSEFSRVPNLKIENWFETSTPRHQH